MGIGTSNILACARAVLATLQPVTGLRSAGVLGMRAKPGKTFQVQANTYFMPIKEGRLRQELLFKAMEGPNEDDSWTIDDSGTAQIALMSNSGGVRHNLPDGTSFNPATPIDDLVLIGTDAPTAVGDFVQGEDAPDYCGIKDLAIYEQFDGPAFELDLRRSPLQKFPAVLLAFQDMQPADGSTIAQTDQQSTRAGSTTKLYKVTYTLSVISSKVEGDGRRRQEGLILTDTIMQLLTDRHEADAGECLSNPGGIQIRQMVRESGPQDVYKKFYIYTILMSCMVTLAQIDLRSFNPWLRSVMKVVKPQVPILADQGPLTLVDNMIIDMTPDQLDFFIDGNFTRASTANFYTAEENPPLVGVASGVRRGSSIVGLYMEPAITNELGAASEDFTAWTPVTGATVVADTEEGPFELVDSADTLTFIADADSSIDLAGLVVVAGEPAAFTVFMKAPGNLSKTKVRLAAVDGAAVEHVSQDIELDSRWKQVLFEFTPTAAGAVTARIKNAVDGQVRSLVVYGAMYSGADARGGAEYVQDGTPKAASQLTFFPRSAPITTAPNLVTPPQMLTGQWNLNFVPQGISPDMLGVDNGGAERVLVALGNGATDLIKLAMKGDPTLTGATLTVTTRGDGVVLVIPDLDWVDGATLTFAVDAAAGTLELSGFLEGEGTYDFPRYVEDALTQDDFLALGTGSDLTAKGTPGHYLSIFLPS